MPAPTALQRTPDEFAGSLTEVQPSETQQDESFVFHHVSTASLDDPVLIDAPLDHPPSSDAMQVDAATGAPLFPPAAESSSALRIETRKVLVPPHRFSPLKAAWPKLYPPLVNHLKLQVRMNVKTRAVELRTCRATTDTGALQKGADFVRAFALGFDVDDAVALLRLDDLYIESFEIKDVKTLQGDHLGRAVGRIAGKDGKTKFAIENASRTRIVLADSKIHILGGFQNIRAARESVVSLILGQPPGKVYGNLRTVSARMKERF